MTTSAAEIRDPASELRKASGSLKRAHLADQLATGVFYVVSGAFVLLLIFFTLYVVWDGIQAFRPEIFSFEATGIGNQFFNTVYLVVLSPSDFLPDRNHGRRLHGRICSARTRKQRFPHRNRNTFFPSFDRRRPVWLSGIHHHGRIPVESVLRRARRIDSFPAAHYCNDIRCFRSTPERL